MCDSFVMSNGHCPWQTQNFWISRPNTSITATKSRLHRLTPAKQETKNKETQQTNCTRGSWVWVGNQRKGRHGRMRSLPLPSLLPPPSSLPPSSFDVVSLSGRKGVSKRVMFRAVLIFVFIFDHFQATFIGLNFSGSEIVGETQVRFTISAGWASSKFRPSRASKTTKCNKSVVCNVCSMYSNCRLSICSASEAETRALSSQRPSDKYKELY